MPNEACTHKFPFAFSILFCIFFFTLLACTLVRTCTTKPNKAYTHKITIRTRLILQKELYSNMTLFAKEPNSNIVLSVKQVQNSIYIRKIPCTCKRAQIHTKEPFVCKTGLLKHDSFRKRAPFLHVYMMLSAKEPAMSAGFQVFTAKEPCTYKKEPYTHTKELCIHTKDPAYMQTRPNTYKRAVYTYQRGLYTSKRAHIHGKSLHT